MTTTFKEKIDIIKTEHNFEIIKKELESLKEYTKINDSMLNYLKDTLIDLKNENEIINLISILTVSTMVPKLKDAVLFKIIELMRFSKMDNVNEILKLIILLKFTLQITNKSYFPELIKLIQNILILFCKDNKLDDLFLPKYKIQKLGKERYFLNFVNDSTFKEINLNLKNVTNLNDLKTDEFKFILLKNLLKLILEIEERYKDIEAFESIFYFIKKILVKISLDYPDLKEDFNKILLSNIQNELTALVLPRQKPKILPMLVPDFNNNKKNIINKEKERVINKKLRREVKSIQREIKKSNSFINSVKLQETLEKDRIRKEKVKQLISEINAERAMFKK